jgi:hypothetical protein
MMENNDFIACIYSMQTYSLLSRHLSGLKAINSLFSFDKNMRASWMVPTVELGQIPVPPSFRGLLQEMDRPNSDTRHTIPHACQHWDYRHPWMAEPDLI